MIGQEGVQTKNRVDSEQAPNGLLNRNSASLRSNSYAYSKFGLGNWNVSNFI